MESTLRMQLPIAKHDQQLAGFLIESMEGIALHSQGIDANHLSVSLDSSTEPELQTFLCAWQFYFNDRAEAVTCLTANEVVMKIACLKDIGDMDHA